MKILFLGYADPRFLVRFRANALERLGHEVTLADPYAWFARQTQGALSGRLHVRTGFRLLQAAACAWVDELVRQHRARPPELVWVDHGELFGARAVERLRQLRCPLILHNLDDPTGPRDGRRFDSLRAAIPGYDLCAVVRAENVPEFLSRGARAVHRVWRSYDEIEHRPFKDPPAIAERFRSEVVFVGTWIRGEERDVFLSRLIDAGIEVAIWGDRWQRSPLWAKIRAHWRGPSLYGREYVAAIQGSKVALGLLSHGNRDLHTVRSMEIPYAGGLLCAERTSEHRELYEEGAEAVFWGAVDECVAGCQRLLREDEARERIRLGGMRRVRRNGVGNESVCGGILEALLQGRGAGAPGAAGSGR